MSITNLRPHVRTLILLALILAVLSHFVLWVPLLPIAVVLVCVALLAV